MACEQNILDVGVTPSVAAPTDLILVTLPDGTSFLRPWSQFLNATPEDVEELVVEAGGNINNGDGEVTISQHIGWRTRLWRNGVLQSLTPRPGQYYYAFNIATGKYTITPAAQTDELFIFQAY